MARARYLHPSVIDSPSVHRLGPTGSFFWVSLVLLADDEGRLHDVPEVLRGKTYPYPHSGVSLRQVKNWLSVMAEEGMILRYVAPNGSRYIQLVKFKNYNKVSHPKPSMIPPPISGNIPEELPEGTPENIRDGLGRVGLSRVGVGQPPFGGAGPTSSKAQSEPPTSPASVRHPGLPAPGGARPGAPPADASGPGASNDEFIETPMGRLPKPCPPGTAARMVAHLLEKADQPPGGES